MAAGTGPIDPRPAATPGSQAPTAPSGTRLPAGAVSCLGVALLAIVLALLLLERFHGIFPNLIHVLQRAADPALYPFDPAIRNSLLGHSSVLIRLAAALDLDLTLPVANVIAYLVIAALGIGAALLIQRDVFAVRGALFQMLLLALLVFGDDKTITDLKISFLAPHPFSITMVAVVVRLYALYFLLTRRYGPAVACEALLMAISVKTGWLLWLVLALVIAADRPRRMWLLFAGLAGALAYPLFQAAQLSQGFDLSQARHVFDVVANAYATEDNPFRIGLPAILATAAACGAAWWLAPRIGAGDADHLSRVTRITVIVSVLVFVAGGLYITFGYRFLAIPALVLLSPARAMEVQSYLFYMLAIVWILRHPSLDNLSRALFLCALALLRMHSHGLGIFIPAAGALAVVGLAWQALCPRVPALAALTGRFVTREGMVLVVTLFFFSALAYFFTNPNRVRDSIDYDSRLGFVEHGVPDTARVMLAALRAAPDRGPTAFIAQQRDGIWGEPRYGYWNGLARISGLSGELYYLTHAPATWREVKDRNRAMTTQLDHLNAQGDTSDTAARAGFATYRAMAIMPESAAARLPGWVRCQSWPGWVALAPDPATARLRACAGAP